jgi:tetratricopeptide (TPR) repeat protein
MPVRYINSCRTTSASVMTTLNTAAFVKEARPPIFKQSTSAIATLPQRKDNSSLQAMQSPGRGGKTKFELLRGIDAHQQRCQSLLAERDDFLMSLYAEKKANEEMRDYCATRIQAIYRGYSRRPRRGYSWSAPRSPGLKFRTWRFAPNEITNELCTLATRANLGPIPGMTLQPRNKAKKQRREIEVAARRRLINFFTMNVARAIARRYMNRVRKDRQNFMAYRIVRFFRMVRAKAWTQKVMQAKRNSCGTIINNLMRKFLANNRVRVRRRIFAAHRRRQESSVIITRNFKKMHKRTLTATAARREELASHAVTLCFTGVFEAALRDPLTTCVREQASDDAAHEAVLALMEEVTEALLHGAAQTVGEIQLREQMQELARLQKQMEEERLHLEAEQRRLEAAEKAGKLAEEKREAAEKKALHEREARQAAQQEEYLEKEREKEMLQAEVQDQSFEELEISAGALSPLRSLNSAMSAMPVSTTKLRGSIADYDAKSLFTFAVVTALGETFERTGVSLEACQDKLGSAKDSFDGGDYAGAFAAYSSVLGVLLSCCGLEAAARADTIDSDTSRETSAAVLKPACLGRLECQSAVILIAQVALFTGDCLFELCKLEGARIKYALARLLRDRVFGEDSAAVAEVNVRLGHVYTAKAQYLAADDAYRCALTKLAPIEAALKESLRPALTPMSRAMSAIDFSREDVGGEDENASTTLNKETDPDVAVRDLDVVQLALVHAYSGQARLFRYWGRYELSLQSCQHAFSSCEALFCSRGERNELLLAEVISTRASLCKVAGLPQKAYELLLEVREVHMEVLGTQHPLTASSSVRLAYVAASLGKYQEALHLVDAAMLVQRADAVTGGSGMTFMGASGSLAAAQSLHCKGWVYLRLARYELSRPLLEASYQLRSDILADETHPCVACGISSMADLATASGEYQDALQNYSVALEIMKGRLTLLPHFRMDDDESSLTANTATIHAITANTMFNKALCLSLYGCGASAEALALFEVVKTAREQYFSLRRHLLEGSSPMFDDALSDDAHSSDVHSRTSLSVVAVDVAIARQLLTMGHIIEAANMATETHSIIRALLSLPDDLDISSLPSASCDLVLADSLQLLGEIAFTYGRWSEANLLLDSCCAIKEAALGDGSPEVAHVAFLMAHNLLGPGYFEEARYTCERGAELLAVHFDKKSAPMANCLFTAATVTRDGGNLTHALELYKHALYVASLFYTERSSIYGLILEGLAECQRRLGATDQALQSFKAAVSVLSQCYGKEHLLTLGPVRGLAQLQIDLRNPREAIALLQDHVLPGVTAALGEKSPLYVFCRGLVGQCHRMSVNTFTDSGEPEDQRQQLEFAAQSLIDDALVFFDTHKYGPYSEQHAWVLAMGGFLGSSRVGTAHVQSGRVGTATEESAQASFRGQASARQSQVSTANGTARSEFTAFDSGLPQYVPVENVMNSLLLTERELVLPLLAGSRPVTAQKTEELLLTEEEWLRVRPTSSAVTSRLDVPSEHTVARIDIPQRPNSR